MKIAEKQDEELKRQWGIFSYVVAAASALNEAQRFEARITCGERSETVRAYQIAIGNGIHFGGGMTVSPEAAIDDGLLDVYAIETASVPELIALAPRLRDGTLVERDDVAFFRGVLGPGRDAGADVGQYRRRGDDEDAGGILGAQGRARGVCPGRSDRSRIGATLDAATVGSSPPHQIRRAS